MPFTRWCVMAGLLAAAAAASAGPQAQQYCNEMYPAENYEPDERSLYVQECIEMYGDDIEAEAASNAQSESVPEPAMETDMTVEAEPVESYYDGTVEEFVDSLPADEGAAE